MKKYKRELKLLAVVFIVLYLLPLFMYFTTDFENANFSTLLYIINPLTLFICSSIETRYTKNFYIFSILIAILFIPLVFTIYSTAYLPCFFLYLIISLLGGLFGLWLNSNKDVLNAFKKATGVMSIVAAVFILLYNIFSNLFWCYKDYCDYGYIFTIGSLYLYMIIALLVMLAIRCLKKKKKKGEDK